MKQPELGKKVLELRTQKGLTQNELVEKCGITVRTLQRIEAGEVSPRIHTVKVIFSALDFDYFSSLNDTQVEQEKTIHPGKIKLGLFYSYVNDLFNLRTNTMKKLSILSIPFLVLTLLFLFNSNDSFSQRRLQRKLVGKWQLCNADSTVCTNVGGVEGLIQYKFITKESFTCCDMLSKTKQIHGVFYGDYTVEKGIYTEFIQSTNGNFRHLFGHTNSFKIHFKKDWMFIKGTNNIYQEIWKKVKE